MLKHYENQLKNNLFHEYLRTVHLILSSTIFRHAKLNNALREDEVWSGIGGSEIGGFGIGCHRADRPK